MDPAEVGVEEERRKLSRQPAGPDPSVHQALSEKPLPRLSAFLEVEAGMRMVPGNGDCLFGAIADQLSQRPDLFPGYLSGAHRPFGDAGKGAAAKRVRREVCRWLEDNVDTECEDMGMTPGEFMKEEAGGLQQYFYGRYSPEGKRTAGMAEDGTWGDALTVWAAAGCYKVVIRSYKIDNPDQSQIFHPVGMKFHVAEIAIIHRDQPQHFNSAHFLNIEIRRLNQKTPSDRAPEPTMDMQTRLDKDVEVVSQHISATAASDPFGNTVPAGQIKQ